MKTREEIEQEYERKSRAIREDYKTKTRVLITNRNDNLHAAEVRRDAALAEAALAELDDPMALTTEELTAIIADLKRALEGRE